MASVSCELHVDAGEPVKQATEIANTVVSLERLLQRVRDELQPLLAGETDSLSVSSDPPATEAGVTVCRFRLSSRKLELIATALRTLNGDLELCHKALDSVC